MLVFHHVGCLVDDIDEALEGYKGVFPVEHVSEKIFVSTQGVYVCFVEMRDKGYIELIQSANEDSIVARLKKKGISYYHIGYTVQDFDAALKDLDERYYKLVNVFHSEAFGQKRCAFMYTPDGQLIELIEA
jgi:catechol 2,3-dioxygenase-like lactoylglutathione lyase family enzyme